jgi:Cys-tRNA(Pro) deacylase
VTPAVRLLRRAGVAFTSHPYAYVDGGGTARFARETGLDEHLVLKTLVMEDDRGVPFLVLMHGDRQVSTRALARHIGARSVQPCDRQAVERHTGYRVGGVSPFGTRRRLPVYLESSASELDTLYVNGGKRGFIVGLRAADLLRLLEPRLVTVARD